MKSKTKFAFLILILLVVHVSPAQATPWFQAAGAAVGQTGNCTAAWPAHQVGDVALLFVETANQAVATPAGFGIVATPTGVGGGAANRTRLTVFWARATSGVMPNVTITDPGDHCYAIILTYRGVITYDNPWDVTGGGIDASADTSVTVTGVTTTVADTLIVQAVSRNLTGANVFSSWTNANLTGITERWDNGTTAGNDGGLGIIDGRMASAGATGNTTATVVSSTNEWLTIALKPNIMSNIYAINNSLSPNGAIMSINPTNSVATIVYSGAPFPLATRAAGLAQCPDGMLYFINQTGTLYQFNPNTPSVAPVVIGNTGLDMIRMTCHPTTGVLYGMPSPVNNLYIINTATGATTAIPLTLPSVTPPAAGSGDIGFDAEGTLYFVGETTAGVAATERLWIINLATNNFENVGAVTGLPFVANGIAFCPQNGPPGCVPDDILLSLTGQTLLYTVSADGGAATPVGVAGAIPAAVYDLSSVNAGISVTKTDSGTLLRLGDSITYTVVITAGAIVSNAVFQDPAVPYINATGVVCAAAGGATCPAPAQVTVANMQGAGITIPAMPIGGSVTFTITAIVTGNPTGTLANTATITLSGQTNSPSDTDSIKKMKTTKWREVFQ